VSAPTTNRPGRQPKPGERAPAFARTAVELSKHIAVLGADQVAEALRLGMADLEPLLAGRVEPTEAGLQRLRRLVRKLGH
jgi:hypothetical protein